MCCVRWAEFDLVLGRGVDVRNTNDEEDVDEELDPTANKLNIFEYAIIPAVSCSLSTYCPAGVVTKGDHTM